MKNNSLKKLLARILVFVMLICNNGIYTLADSIDNVVETIPETVITNYHDANVEEESKVINENEQVEKETILEPEAAEEENDVFEEEPEDADEVLNSEVNESETSETAENVEETNETINDEETDEIINDETTINEVITNEEETKETLNDESAEIEVESDETATNEVVTDKTANNENKTDDSENDETSVDEMTTIVSDDIVNDTTKIDETETGATIVDEAETNVLETNKETNIEDASIESLVESKNLETNEIKESSTDTSLSIDTLKSITELSEIDTVATKSNLENVISENKELVDLLKKHNVTVDSVETIDFLKTVELSIDGDKLIGKFNNKMYFIDDNFVIYYGPKANAADGLFGGTVGVNQTITLDFGINMPGINKASNSWVDSPWARQNPIPTSINFTGDCGEIIYNFFATGDGATAGLLDDPTKLKVNYGSGDHLQLPQFGDIWNGFKFIGWVDEDGVNLNTSQNGTFMYSFQYDGDVTYTATWEKVTTLVATLSISYFRATYSAALKTPYIFSPATTSVPLIATANIIKYHGDYIYRDPADILGYKISHVLISTFSRASNNFKDLGRDALLTIDANNKNFIAFDVTSDLKMTNSFSLDGCLPNHPLYIEYYYEPDVSQSNAFKVYYVSENGEELRANDEYSYPPETVITATPVETPRNGYKFKRVELAETPEDLEYGVFGIGKYHTASESYTEADLEKNHGVFKAVMPNQEVYLYYYYELTGVNVELKIRTEIQQPDGTYIVSTTSQIGPIGSTNVREVTVDNKEDEGYGRPVLGVTNFMEQGFNYTGGIGGNDGKLRYYIDTEGEHILTIKYSYNYSSDYWTKVLYRYLSSGHGSIAATAGSKALDNRFFKRGGTYTIGELTADITVTPDTNYLCKWYVSNSAGTDGVGSALTGNVTIPNSSAYTLFAKFEEDPNRWVDISFTGADNCSISGSTALHLVKDTAITVAHLPNVTVNTGYTHHNSEWIDSNGNIKKVGGTGNTGIFDVTATYKPNIVPNVSGYADAVKPVVYLSYDTNGFGKANLFGSYPDRKYVLADRNSKVIKVVNGNLVTNEFSNLTPGTTYKMFEAKSEATIPTVGSVISESGTVISAPYTFGIKATDETNATYANGTITISPKTGVSYALLDDRYNIVKDWSTNPSFTGLTKGTYYLVVAKGTNDTVVANHDDVIRNGVVVYTTTNDLSERKYRLVLVGDNTIYAMNAGSYQTVTFDTYSAKVYSVAEGTEVTIRSANGKRTFAITNNVLLNENSTANTFNMPSSDVVINNYELSNVAGAGNIPNTIEVYNNGVKLSLLNLATVKNTLNNDPNIANAINTNCTVNHYIVINKYATNKTLINSFNNTLGKVAPYEYTIDVATMVLSLPYKNSEAENIDSTAFLSFDKEMIGNYAYKMNDGSAVDGVYTTTDNLYGVAKFDLSLNSAKSVNYIKKHKVNVICNISGIEFDENFYVADSDKITSADNYNVLRDRLKNIFDNAVPDSNSKEYIYKNILEGTAVFNKDTTIINNTKNLTLNYVLNQEREDNKTLLSNEIVAAITKLGTLINEEVRTRLQDAINKASDIRAEQKSHPYTAKELYDAFQELKKAKENAIDIIIDDGDEVVVNIDSNGGTVNMSTISVTVGNNYTYNELLLVEALRSGYTLDYWCSTKDGKGDVITNETVVGMEPLDTIYAIWKADEKPNPKPRPYNPGGGGGGGGGGGSGRTQSSVLTDKKLVNEINIGTLNYGNNSSAVVPIVGQTVWVAENEQSGKFYLFDQNTNKIELKIGNKNTFESIGNQWVVITDANNVVKTYRTDAYGNVLAGKYATEDGNVYYLSEVQGDNYGSLVIGWILDPKTNYWYYSNPQTGTLLTGWNTIDGKDYYFIKPDDKATNGFTNEEIYTRNIYGMMLTNTNTLDGFRIDSNGQRVYDKPYLLNATQ